MAVTVVYTKNQAKITLSVPGVTLDSQSWDTFSGGGREADTGYYNPGGMAPSIPHGGPTHRNQITLERAIDDSMIGFYLALDGAVNSPCTVGVQLLKTAKSTAGKQRTYSGILRSVTPPDTDSTSADVQKLQVVIETGESITA